MESANDGIILIDKNEGETSFDVVRKVRSTLKIKRVGHAGTLDPFANGLLIVLLGQGTKLSPYLMEGEKVYRGTIRLGEETDTQDRTGRIVQTRPVPGLERKQIEEGAEFFKGEIEQVPPVFSAVKYKGQRAYKFGRKGIPIKLEKRKVKIRAVKILSVDLPEITMEVTCSSGTYIRTLAADLGNKLGTVAHLKTLRRLSSGPFKVRDALDSGQIGYPDSSPLIRKRIIPMRTALPHIMETRVDDRMARKIGTGYRPRWNELMDVSPRPDLQGGYVKIICEETLVAIMKVSGVSPDGKGELSIMRVFN